MSGLKLSSLALLTSVVSAGCGGSNGNPSRFPDAALCVATTPPTLVACGNAVQAGTKSIIEIRGSLLCSGAEACGVKTDGMSLTVRGAPGASIRRIDHHDYPLFQVLNAPSAAISDLFLDEDADVPCVPVTPTNPPLDNSIQCARTIDLFGVTDVSLDRLTIASSKSVGAEIGHCGNVRVTHVRFISSYLFGLQVGAVSRGLTIEDSLFWHIDSNALVLSDMHGTEVAPLVVSRTMLDHNHRDDVYFTCGPQSNEQCSGGQLLLAGKIDFLNVQQSVIRLGEPDVGNSPVTGVEIGTPSIHDVTFTGNDIHTHGMWAIGIDELDPGASDVARISVVNNKLYDNGTFPGYNGDNVGNPGTAITESGTCHTADCASVPFGALWALPGGTVSWATNDLGAPTVTVDGAQMATDANGQITAPPGATVILFNGSNEIDRLIVP